MSHHVAIWSSVYFWSEWLIRIVMLVYVPQRRSPSAARAWLLFIFMLPWPGLILYGVFGRAYLSRRRLALQRQALERLQTAGSKFLPASVSPDELPAEVRGTARLAENLGRFGPVGGNRLELLADYDAAIDRLAEDIDGATDHVHLLYYIFADDAATRRVSDALARAVLRGVECRVLLDSHGSKKWLSTLVPRLTKAGVEVHELLPYRLFRPNPAHVDLRNHRKIAVIDGRIGYVGSQNLVNACFKPGIVYEELVVRAVGPVVAQLQAIFVADHYFETERVENEPGTFPVIAQAGDSLAQVLPSGPGFPQANNQRLFVNLIHTARQRVVITTPYFIPDEGLLQALEIAVIARDRSPSGPLPQVRPVTVGLATVLLRTVARNRRPDTPIPRRVLARQAPQHRRRGRGHRFQQPGPALRSF